MVGVAEMEEKWTHEGCFGGRDVRTCLRMKYGE